MILKKYYYAAGRIDIIEAEVARRWGWHISTDFEYNV